MQPLTLLEVAALVALKTPCVLSLSADKLNPKLYP